MYYVFTKIVKCLCGQLYLVYTAIKKGYNVDVDNFIKSFQQNERRSPYLHLIFIQTSVHIRTDMKH